MRVPHRIARAERGERQRDGDVDNRGVEAVPAREACPAGLGQVRHDGRARAADRHLIALSSTAQPTRDGRASSKASRRKSQEQERR